MLNSNNALIATNVPNDTKSLCTWCAWTILTIRADTLFQWNGLIFTLEVTSNFLVTGATISGGGGGAGGGGINAAIKIKISIKLSATL